MDAQDTLHSAKVIMFIYSIVRLQRTQYNLDILKLYPPRLVLVGFRNGFERDFTVKLT